ncbi:MAG: hypothetical protein MJK04_29985 [Psychrosphaera sp.]|nr:hypothetical protein [Psychrosphaera sp.]
MAALNIEKDLHYFLEDVVDQESFLKFIQARLFDRRGLEGITPDDFGLAGEPELVNNPWKQFAVFLYCGKIYE